MSLLYRVLIGDAEVQLSALPPGSVDCIITSPPYFHLRDYHTGQWVGGDPACSRAVRLTPSAASSTLEGARSGVGHALEGVVGACPRCGAVRVDAQIGLEPTPEAYVARLVSVFRALRRVLTPTGTAWLVLGDTFAHDDKWGGATGGKHRQALHGAPAGRGRTHTGLPPKSLIGIPWRVALALQDDGWILRSDIVWAKPQPLPESVKDRPTRAHEYIFLLAAQPHYYYDAEAIKEPGVTHTYDRRYGPGALPRHRAQEAWNQHGPFTPHHGFQAMDSSQGRNRRDVWTVATAQFSGAHFATFPEALVEPMVLAGCPVGGVVLDPFAGSGTTLAVAVRLGRRAIGIELNADYVPLIHQRMADVRVRQISLFADEAAPSRVGR